MKIMNKLLLIIIFPTLCYAGQDSDRCYDDLSLFLKSSILADKFKSNPTFEELASTQNASDEEKIVIAKYAGMSRTCNNLEIQEMPKDVHPGFPEIFKQSENEKQRLLIDLYNKKISFGQFLVESQNQVDVSNKKLSALRDEVETNKQIAKAQQKAETSRAWSDFFGSMSRAVAPRGSRNCSPNGTGGYICYQN